MHLIPPLDNLLKYFQLLPELIENLFHFLLLIGSIRISYKIIFLEQTLSWHIRQTCGSIKITPVSRAYKLILKLGKDLLYTKSSRNSTPFLH